MNLPDSFSNEKLEIHDGVKKIYRTAADLVRRLDRICKHSTICDDLFTAEAKILRVKLREQCERLMFCDPIGHGKKAEELLWRKVYYDVITSGKQLRKVGDDVLRLCDHINAGSGAYHHLIFRIETEFDIRNGVSDFLSTLNRYKKICFEAKLANDWKENTDKNEWAKPALHRCLICLGDLARYRQELMENATPQVSSRYYYQAAAFMPSAGMPHNQLGTLSASKNYGCDATYHYMRCLYSAQSFEGSKGNLERIFNKANKLVTNNAHLSAKENCIKRCIARFLKFCQVCCTDDKKNCSVQLERLCQEILGDFYVWLSSDTNLDDLDDQLVFRIVVMAIMCTNRVSVGGSRNQSAAIAFTLAIFSHLLHFILLRLQSVRTNNGNSSKQNGNTKQKSKLYKKRLRRPRRTSGSNSGIEDSDLSEADANTDEDSDETTTDASEMGDENTSQESDDDETVEKSLTNGNESKINGEKSKCRSARAKNAKTPRDELTKNLISVETMLMCVKLCADWLKGQSEILEMCAHGCQLLCTRLVSFFNFVSPVLNWQMKDGIFDSELLIGLKMCKQGQEWTNTRPLAEDVTVCGIPVFDNVNKEMNFESAHRVWINSQETMALRITCLHQFGLILARTESSGLNFDPTSCEFTYKADTDHKTTATDHKNEFDVQKKKKVMENMAHLWLKAEVTELETSVESSRVRRLSPYLVVTWGVLIDHLNVLRHLVASRRFIVVIPSVVISHLDWIKKESIQARDAIRWLEAEFHRGNRYLRAQKAHEHASLSPIKYPKRKEKDAWNLFQIFECCKHLSDQNSSTLNSGLVTLLTANTEQWTTINVRLLADTTGINTETIDVFINKWQNDTKNGAANIREH